MYHVTLRSVNYSNYGVIGTPQCHITHYIFYSELSVVYIFLSTSQDRFCNVVSYIASYFVLKEHNCGIIGSSLIMNDCPQRPRETSSCFHIYKIHDLVK